MPQIVSSKSAGRRPDPPRQHLVQMGHAGRGRSRRRAPCASCLLGRRSDPIRRGGNLRLRQRGRRPAAREIHCFVDLIVPPRRHRDAHRRRRCVATKGAPVYGRGLTAVEARHLATMYVVCSCAAGPGVWVFLSPPCSCRHELD
ncbi:hypothetical protein VPH35_023249 [Triticum aestivum]